MPIPSEKEAVLRFATAGLIILINAEPARVLAVILGLLTDYAICHQTDVNPVAALRCAPRRVDFRLMADYLSIKQTKDS